MAAASDAIIPLSNAEEVAAPRIGALLTRLLGCVLMALPIGIGFYIASKIGNVSPDEAMRRIWPSILALLVGLVLIAAVPSLSITFL